MARPQGSIHSPDGAERPTPVRAIEAPAPPPPKRRAVWVVAIFSAGLMLARTWPVCPAWLWFLACALCAGAGLWLRGQGALVALGLACLCFGAGHLQSRVSERPADSIAHHLSHTPALLTIEGRLERDPELGPALRGEFARYSRGVHDQVVTRCLVRVSTIVANGARTPVSGSLWVRIDEPVTDRRAGDAVVLTGMASRLEPPGNPGQPDGPALARQRGIVGRITLPRAELLTAPATPHWHDSWRAIPARIATLLRGRAAGWLLRHSDGHPGGARAERAFLLAMFLGEETADLRPVSDAFIRLGIAHLIAISGANLMVLAMTAMLAARLLGERPVLEPILVASIILAYLMIVPAEAPILRAAMIVLAFQLAALFGRRYDRLTILAWTMLAALLWRPLDLWSPGFQLSYGVVAGLILFADPLRQRMFGEPPPPDSLRVAGRMIEHLKIATAAALVAWFIASPIAAYHMGIVAPFGVVTSVLLLAPMSALMIAGYLALIASAIAPAVGEWASGPMMLGARGIIALVDVLDGAPGATVRLPALPALWVVGALALAAWVMWRIKHRMEHPAWTRPVDAAPSSAERLDPLVRWAGAAALAGWLVWTLARPPLPAGVALRVDMFDVGDGTCILLRSGRESLLFDAGSSWPAIGERELPRALRAVGAWCIPRAVISHPNLDHYNALPDLAEPLGLRAAWVNERFARAIAQPSGDGSQDNPVEHLAQRLRALDVSARPLVAGDSFTLGRARIRVLSPPSGERYRHLNDTSLVLLVTVPTAAGERRLLLCGDIQDEALADLMTREPGLRADVMEAPHHGSARPAAIEVVEHVNPSIVLQSTGPTRVNDDRWEHVRAARKWLTTALDGAAQVDFVDDGTVIHRAHRAENQDRVAQPLSVNMRNSRTVAASDLTS